MVQIGSTPVRSQLLIISRGELPVEWNLGETVLAIRLFPGEVEGSPVLYLRLSQSLEAEAFVQIMRTSQYNATAVGASVLEAACGGCR